jgi:hypothetical protein
MISNPFQPSNGMAYGWYMDVPQGLSRGPTRISNRCGRGFEVRTFECSSRGRTEKEFGGEGGSHENGCGGLARRQTSPTALTRALGGGLVRRTGLAAALGFAFEGDGKHPKLKTVLSVLDAMGFQLHVTIRRDARARLARPKAVPSASAERKV